MDMTCRMSSSMILSLCKHGAGRLHEGNETKILILDTLITSCGIQVYNFSLGYMQGNAWDHLE